MALNRRQQAEVVADALLEQGFKAEVHDYHDGPAIEIEERASSLSGPHKWKGYVRSAILDIKTDGRLAYSGSVAPQLKKKIDEALAKYDIQRFIGNPSEREEAIFIALVGDERAIESNAWEQLIEGKASVGESARKLGLVDDKGITPDGWDLLNREDIPKVERNVMAWLHEHFEYARDEGHDNHGDLIGSIEFDVMDSDQAALIDEGVRDFIDLNSMMSKSGKWMAFKGVSDFAQTIIDGYVKFQVSDQVEELIEQTLEHAQKRKSIRR